MDALAELRWLKANPAFAERPASFSEFLGPDYLNVEKKIRPAIREVLTDIMGDEVDGKRMTRYARAMVTGGVGIGKTTIASVTLPYLAHWVLCLRDPQDFFNLLPGSRIAFMQMSTSEGQAKEVVFGDIKARVQYSPWFRDNYPFDPLFKIQLRFPKEVWILPGDSAETSFEGYNICLDEETEILTTTGWKRYDELNVGDLALTLNHQTGMSEWQPVEQVHVFPDAERILTRMEGTSFSSLSTSDHRWPVVTTSGIRKWRTTATLGDSDGVPLSAMSADRPVDPKWSDALVEAVGWFWTEGALVGRSGAVIYQRAGSLGSDRIRACLTKVFGPPVDRFATTYKSIGAPACWRENVNCSLDARTGKPKNLCEFRLSTEAGKVLLEHAPARVPTHSFLLELTQAQLELFISVSLLADNCGPNKLAQKSHPMAEAFAFACILAGHAISIRPHKTPGRDYDMLLVQIRSKKVVRPIAASRKGGTFVVRPERHTGIIWCPSLKNHTWMARREGSVYFTGNCGGILDEADSHKVTKERDYAEMGYDTINSRIESRFGNKGFLLVIGQMKKSNGFAAKKYKEFVEDPGAYAVRMSIWESLGWGHFSKPDGTRDSFWYDIKRKQIVPEAASLIGSPNIIEIPMMYHNPFKVNPEKALRDLAGIPPTVGDPFISLEYKIGEARDRWVHRNDGLTSPFTPDGRIEPWFVCKDRLKRVVHIDLAFSAKGDAMGFAMGHVREVVDIDGEKKPYIVFDMLARWKAQPGSELMLGDVRRFIYALRDDMNFRITKVTMDGFESTDSRQQFVKHRFEVDRVSMDKSKMAYEDLREALYENRIEFPKYMAYLNYGDTETVEIAYRELSELSDVGTKIDHPHSGSKDVADAMAGVVYTLLGDRSYRRNVISLDSVRERRATGTDGADRALGGIRHPAMSIWGDPQAPVPPQMGDGGGIVPLR